MRTLHLLRHAKSAWNQPQLSDRERPLNKRGRLAAPRMGAALASRLAPQPVAVSPAQRAQLTLAGLCAGWPGLAEQAHRTEESLYTFACEDLLDWLSAQHPGGDSLFLIGHNPALTELINYLDVDARLPNLPTAGYACLTLDIDDWRAVRAGCGRLVQTLLPRELAAT